MVKITHKYPKQIKDFTLEEAKLDGFQSVKEFQDGVLKVNHKDPNVIKNREHWAFITRWEPIKESVPTEITSPQPKKITIFDYI